jgi:hypothetical protein
MDAWTLILMFGVSAIWLSLAAGVVHRVKAVRAEGLEPPQAKPNGT